jgi:hypothetical protein
MPAKRARSFQRRNRVRNRATRSEPAGASTKLWSRASPGLTERNGCSRRKCRSAGWQPAARCAAMLPAARLRHATTRFRQELAPRPAECDVLARPALGARAQTRRPCRADADLARAAPGISAADEHDGATAFRRAHGERLHRTRSKENSTHPDQRTSKAGFVSVSPGDAPMQNGSRPDCPCAGRSIQDRLS